MAILEQTLSRSPGDELARLQAAGQAAFEEGRLDESVALLTQALEWAAEHEDRQRVDLAFCNLTSVTISRDGTAALDGGAMNRLREILMRNEDLTCCRLAAYNLARFYELRKETRKGLFYSRLALDRSQLLEREDWVASSRNQIGNLLMAQSCFEEAISEYREALELHPAHAEERRALIQLNVGYAALVRGDLGRGFELLYRSLRTLRRCGMRRGVMFAHLDLCYAHLDAGRQRDARRHGERGLALAEELGEAEATKNALYLLGEAARSGGDEGCARHCFSRLAAEFYPGSSGISSFLMAVDVRKMVNLRA